MTGTTSQFTQAAARDYFQSLDAEEIKHIAVSLNELLMMNKWYFH